MHELAFEAQQKLIENETNYITSSLNHCSKNFVLSRANNFLFNEPTNKLVL